MPAFLTFAGEYHNASEERDLATAARSHTYLHKDVDYGLARVRCLAGRVRATASAAVWERFRALGEEIIEEGKERVFELRTLDHTFDQKNRVVVESLSPSSRYRVDFVSWDR